MTITRTATGFIVTAATTVTVTFITYEGTRQAAVKPDELPTAFYLEPILPHNLGRVAYTAARRWARWEPRK